MAAPRPGLCCSHQAVQQHSGRISLSVSVLCCPQRSAPLRHPGHRRSAAALPVWAVSARLMPPREFVVTLVPRRLGPSILGRVPLLGLDASSFGSCLAWHRLFAHLNERAFVVFHPRPRTRSSPHPFSLLVPASDGNWSWQTKFLTVTSWASVLVALPLPPPQTKALEPSCLCGLPPSSPSRRRASSDHLP